MLFHKRPSALVLINVAGYRTPINSFRRFSNETNDLLSFLSREREIIVFKSGLEDDTLADDKFKVSLVKG